MWPGLDAIFHNPSGKKSDKVPAADGDKPIAPNASQATSPMIREADPTPTAKPLELSPKKAQKIVVSVVYERVTILETFIYIAIGVAVLVGIVTVMGNSKVAKETTEKLKEKYPKGKFHFSTDDQSYCTVDFESSKVILGLGSYRSGVLGTESPYEVEYGFDSIASVEVQRDGATIASTNRGSQALGAAAGALAFGGIGAVIGGLSGSSSQNETVRRISLLIRVRDTTYPVHSITFFLWNADKKGVKVTNSVVKHALGQVEIFAAHFANAIHTSEQATPAAKIAELAPTSASLTDQIRELAAMRDAGALTEAEFAAAKSKLLA